jgi:hypothetical protein
MPAFGAQTLLQVAGVPASHWADASRTSRDALRQHALASSDPRVLVSASRIAFEDAPATYRLRAVPLDAASGDPQSRLLERFAHTRTKGKRNSAATGRGATALQLQQADDAAVQAMLGRLRAKR